MATVRITNDIKWEIISNLRNKFNLRINTIDKEIQSFDVAQEIIEHYIPKEQRDAAQVLGTRWLHANSRMYVSIKTADERLYTWIVDIPQVFTPIGFVDGRPPNTILPGMKHHDAILELVNEREALLKERDTTQKQVEYLLSNTSTLNKVTEVWPSVVDYIHPKTRDKLKEPVVKHPRVKRGPPVISDDLKASLVTLNLTK